MFSNNTEPIFSYCKGVSQLHIGMTHNTQRYLIYSKSFPQKNQLKVTQQIEKLHKAHQTSKQLIEN